MAYIRKNTVSVQRLSSTLREKPKISPIFAFTLNI